MHLLVWGATKPVRARLFSAAAAGAFHPQFGGSAEGPATLAPHVTTFTGAGYPRLAAVLETLGVAVGNSRYAWCTITNPLGSSLPSPYLIHPI